MLADLENAKRNAKPFLNSCRNIDGWGYVTGAPAKGAVHPIATLLHLTIHNDIRTQNDGLKISDDLCQNLQSLNRQFPKIEDRYKSKLYLQTLCFSLNALDLLKSLDDQIVNTTIEDMSKLSVSPYLHAHGCDIGRPGSGNFALFIAQVMIFAKKLGIRNTDNSMNDWITFHKNTMNNIGFWGPSESRPYLQFQNGFHQYEVFSFLGVDDVPWDKCAKHVATLGQKEARFAPYPGGGACFDYDAIFFLTSPFLSKRTEYHAILERSFKKIIASQGECGGFAETTQLDPNRLKRIAPLIVHIFSGPRLGFGERGRYAMSLLRKKNLRMRDFQWLDRGAGWGEANIWCTWFRIMAAQKCFNALFPENKVSSGFLSSVGVGGYNA